jgi:hypothetical protein
LVRAYFTFFSLRLASLPGPLSPGNDDWISRSTELLDSNNDHGPSYWPYELCSGGDV